jgi:hypothetical protein
VGIKQFMATPYNTKESIGWVMRHVTGPSKKHSGLVKGMPHSHELNRGVTVKYRLAIVGDIMTIRSGRVEFGPKLREFIKGSDYLVGNFEGTITNAVRPGLTLAFEERHAPRIIDALTDLFAPEKTCLCVSNNHSGDFGKAEFFRSIELLEAEGFRLFGWLERPHLDIENSLRLVCGTMWTNKPCDYICMLKGAEERVRPGVFNLLYPHFGYEFELYPRPEMVELGRKLTQKFDALVGHHAHCPQPVTAHSVGGVNKLIAYSAGDFLGSYKTKKYQYGMIIKAEIGIAPNGSWLMGRAEWRFTRYVPGPKGRITVDITDEDLFT